MGYVLAAALVVWIGTFLYMIVLITRERKLHRELDDLRKMVDHWSNTPS